MTRLCGSGATFLVAALSASCSLFALDVSHVDIGIAAIPPYWKGLEGIELVLVWRDVAGSQRRLPVSPGESRAIELQRGQRSAVIVEASYKGRPLRPAGAIWPDDLSLTAGISGSQRLETRWFEGWTACVLRALDDLGEEGGVDFVRLDAEARARLADPWLVDPRRVALAILERSFRVDSLSVGASRRMILPPVGPWYGESPFAEAPILLDGEWEVDVAPGFHRWYSGDLELFVAVPADGEPVMLLRGIE